MGQVDEDIGQLEAGALVEGTTQARMPGLGGVQPPGLIGGRDRSGAERGCEATTGAGPRGGRAQKRSRARDQGPEDAGPEEPCNKRERGEDGAVGAARMEDGCQKDSQKTTQMRTPAEEEKPD